MLLCGLSGLWGHDVTPDLCIPLLLQSRLHQNCSELIHPINDTHSLNDTTWCSWAPFGKNVASGSSLSLTSPYPGRGCLRPERASCRGSQAASFLFLLSAFRPEQLQGVTGGCGQCLPCGLCHRHVYQVREIRACDRPEQYCSKLPPPLD